MYAEVMKSNINQKNVLIGQDLKSSWSSSTCCKVATCLPADDCFYYFKQYFSTLEWRSMQLKSIWIQALNFTSTSFAFLFQKKGMREKKSSSSKISSYLPAYICTCVFCTHIQIHICRDLVHLNSSGSSRVWSRSLGSHLSNPRAMCVKWRLLLLLLVQK